MVGWLRRLFTGEPDCRHEYETFKHLKVLDCGQWSQTEYHLKCKKCGWVCRRTL